MVSDCGHICEESRTTYDLEVERERDDVRLWTHMQREEEVPAEGGEGPWWSQIMDQDAKRAGQRTGWRWRKSVMVSDRGPGCEKTRTTYELEVERERDGVRLWTRMRTEQDDILTTGGEGA